MADRPYLTSAEAATYCGFKTIGGIQQAVRRGKLKPAGRRGGTGTYVFAKEDLDAFLTGGLQPHERLFVAPEVNEAARLGAAAARDGTSATARSPRGKAKSAAETALTPAQKPPQKTAPKRAATGTALGPATGKATGRSAAKPVAKPANSKSMVGPGRAAADDPIARIVQALSVDPHKRDKRAKAKRRSR